MRVLIIRFSQRDSLPGIELEYNDQKTEWRKVGLPSFSEGRFFGSAEDARELGIDLFEAMISAEEQLLYRATMGDDDGFRLLLFVIPTECQEFRDIPWELLSDPELDGFLIDQKIQIIRSHGNPVLAEAS